MTWFKVDDNLSFHRKVVAAGNASMGLWVRAGSWCAQHLTDGFIPDEMISILGTPAQRAKLIKVGLWLEVDDGCVFHQWNENGRQPTSESVLEKRERAADRQAKHRANSYKKMQASEPSNAVTDPSVTPPVTPLLTPPPSRPVPSSYEEEEITAPTAPQSAQPLVGEWISSCRRRPPAAVIGQVSKTIKGLLEEGIDPADVRVGLQLWAAKGLHPSALPSVVNELMNATPAAVPRPNRRPTADDKIAALQALKTGNRTNANVYALPRGAAQ